MTTIGAIELTGGVDPKAGEDIQKGDKLTAAFEIE